MMTAGNSDDCRRTKYSLDAFTEVCGGASPLLLECEHYGKSPVRRRIFSQPFVLIGSGARTDLCLTHDGVASRHAYLQVIGPRVFAVDLKSKTGIVWEGESEAKRWGWIKPGRGLRIGPYQVGLSASWHEQAKATAPNFMVEDPLAEGSYRGLGLSFPKLTLELVDGPSEAIGAKFRINRLLSLAGYSRSCQIMIRAKGIWPYHAAFVMTPRGVWLIDLVGYVAGVTINGSHARCARIDEGDEVKIGGLRWLARYRGSSSASTSKASTSLAASSASGAASVAAAAPVYSPSARFRAILEEIDHCCTHLTASDSTISEAPALSPAATPALAYSTPEPAPTLPIAHSPSSFESALLAQQSQFIQAFSQVQQIAIEAAETLQGLQREQAQTRTEMEQMRRIAAEFRDLGSSASPGPLAIRSAPVSASSLIPAAALAPPLISVPLVALESQLAVSVHAPSHGNGNGNGNGNGHSIGTSLALSRRDGDEASADIAPDSSHIDLYQKISAIQRGRQTTLQRLLSMIGGSE